MRIIPDIKIDVNIKITTGIKMEENEYDMKRMIFVWYLNGFVLKDWVSQLIL